MTGAELFGVIGPAAVKSLGLLLAGWLVARLIGRRSAAVKHLVWMATLVGCLALPLAEAGFPDALRVDVGPVAGALTEGLEAVAVALGEADPEGRGATGDAAATGPPAADRLPGSEAGRASSGGDLTSALATGAALLWLAGTLAVLLHVTWGLVRLVRIRRRARPVEEVGGVAVDELRRTASESGLVVRVSSEISLPVVQGVFHPTLLVPQEALDRWSADRTRAVLLHEAGHVERRDFTSHLIGRLACALYWFNPFVWWAARELRKEQERACDDAVIRAGHRPSSYARHLLSIAREGAGSAAGAGVSMAHWPDLEGRVLALLREDADRSPARGGWRAGIAVLALAVVAGLGAVSFTSVGAASPGSAPDGPTHPAPLLAASESEGEDLQVSRLVAALGHPASGVRKEAVRRLGELEDPSAVPALEKVMLADESRRIRRAATWAIGESESEGAVKALRRGLSAVDDGKLRRAMVRALGETERASAVPLLTEALDGPDRKTRWHALEALKENGTEPARAAFRRVLSGDDPELRAMARRLLKKRRDHGKKKKS